MAIALALAAGVYLDGGLGLWEFAFAIAVGITAYRGLTSYRWITAGWQHGLGSRPRSVQPFSPPSSPNHRALN